MRGGESMNAKASGAVASGGSRRSFLSGALASFGAGAVGGRVFAAPPGWKPPKKPNLVFGILSDTHLMVEWDGKSLYRTMSFSYIRNALKLFKGRGIDALVHLGDAAHRGAVRELEFHRELFEEAFGKSGGPVKLFVAGNHEWFGECDRIRKIWPDPEVWKEHALCADFPRHWERVWGEKYEGVWHKEVKGYHFFGRHWDDKVDEMRQADLINGKAKELSLAGRKPFFVLSHKRNHFKCNHSLRAFPNAVAFCGHWHQSNADWKTIYYDSFGGFFPTIQCGACRFDGQNTLGAGEGTFKVPADVDVNAEGKEQGWHNNKVQSRQAMIVNVYDDMVVFERHEVGEGGKLGPDWIMPLGEWEQVDGKWKMDGRSHPFSRDELAKTVGEPEFGRSAKLKVEAVKLQDGGDAVRLSIPLADGNPASRVYAYDVVVVGADAQERVPPRLFKSVYFEGVNAGIGHEPQGGVTTLEIPKAELPAGNVLIFAVRPLSSLGTKGKAIAAKYAPKATVRS